MLTRGQASSPWSGFLPTKSEQARREVIGRQSTEPAAFVVRSIPGDVRERRESHRLQTVTQRPFTGVVQEHPAQALSGMTRNDRDLLDVTRSVYDFPE